MGHKESNQTNKNIEYRYLLRFKIYSEGMANTDNVEPHQTAPHQDLHHLLMCLTICLNSYDKYTKKKTQ